MRHEKKAVIGAVFKFLAGRLTLIYAMKPHARIIGMRLINESYAV